ncbi:MAG TPA: TonB-dependent receptor [Gemmatimonadales bacterium]|nr:TonB-dependent receptor [Gemmatimonadales bacterium]
MSTRLASALVSAVVVTLLLTPVRTVSSQSSSGAISGRVTDTTGLSLYAANVRIVGTPFNAATEQSGAFRFAGVSDGSYWVRVTALGYAPESSQVTVDGSRTATVSARLHPAAVLLSPVAINAQRMGETKRAALNHQQAAANIVTVLSGDEIRALPNANAAEAAGRIPGVAIERDEGEGKFVQIRGTEPRLSNVTVDGSHVPGTEKGDRIPKLDDVPSDLLGAIEVSKTLTADMDADAIGGSVNLVTKTPEGRPRGYLSGQFGHITLLNHTTEQGGLVYGGRSEDGRLGFLLGGSLDRFNRVINDVEPAWAVDGTGRSYPVEWSERDYTYYRSRFGLGGDLDYRFASGGTAYIKGLWSLFKNYGTRYVIDVSSSGDSAAAGPIGYGTGVSPTREVQQRRPMEQLWGMTAGASHPLGRASLNYSLNLAGTRQSVVNYRSNPFGYTGNGLTIRYDGSNSAMPVYQYISAAQSDSAGNPGNYALSEYSLSDGLTTGRDIGGAVNLLLPYNWGTEPAGVKLGLRLRDEAKHFTSRRASFAPTGPLLLSQVVGGFSDPSYYSALSTSFEPFGSVPDDGRTVSWEDAHPADFANQTDSVGDALSSFSGSERVFAGYVMNDVDLGRAHLNLGVRVEQTHSSYTGHVAATDTLGATTVTTVPGTQDYTDVFPSAQLRYSAGENTNIRLAVTRAIARPNYSDLAPSLSGSIGAIYQHDYSNLSSGNPNLKPQHAWNVDLMFERFLPSVGVISGGVFYKRITDFIETRTFVYDGPYTPFQGYYGTEPQNGGNGHLLGFEVNWAEHLTFLPGVLAGFGFDANYTRVSSKVTIDTTGRTAQLLRQAPDLANIALTYARGALSGEVAWTYNGANITAYGDGTPTAGGDNYFYAHSQIDASLIFSVTPAAQLQLQALNLNNAVFGFFNGTPDHAFNIQREYYGRTFYVGMKYGF